jgi:hypothetical protein
MLSSRITSEEQGHTPFSCTKAEALFLSRCHQILDVPMVEPEYRIEGRNSRIAHVASSRWIVEIGTPGFRL